MKIQDLLDMRRVAELVGDGYLRERAHPRHPSLRILGYTEKAQWERLWVHETVTCRGLVYEAGSGEVLARPWPKFFNHGEHGQDHLAGVELDLDAPVQVTDKMDGSLGIIFRNPFTGEWEVATRGSFDSDQARLANDQFLPRLLASAPAEGSGHEESWQPMDGYTYLAEIIHPSNRIVLDYGEKQGLALLGGVHIETGGVLGPEFDLSWPDHVTETFEARTLAEALAMEPRPNAEGLVVRYLDSGVMVKIKQEDYVRLHKIVTGLSDRAVWEHMRQNGGNIEGMADAIPDEFHQWLGMTAAGFWGAFSGIRDKAESDYQEIVSSLEDPSDRKAFAELAKLNKRPHLMFQLLDGRDPSEAIWKELRPVGVRYMSEAAREEDVA